jgi:hypothetical protein
MGAVYCIRVCTFGWCARAKLRGCGPGMETNLIDMIWKDIPVIKDCVVNNPRRGAAVLLGLLSLS